MYSTLPKKWSARGWVDIGSDVNWEDHGGMWSRPGEKAGIFYVVRFDNTEDWGDGGPGYKFYADVRQVNLHQLGDSARREKLEEFSGWEDMDQESQQLALVYAMASEGAAAPMYEETGNHAMAVRAACFREVEGLLADAGLRNRRLNRIVNAVGMTAAEYGRGEMKFRQPAAAKEIKQADLSGECWTVQMQGLIACDSCEFAGSRDCGGQRILRTLKNAKGVPVGPDGLESNKNL